MFNKKSKKMDMKSEENMISENEEAKSEITNEANSNVSDEASGNAVNDKDSGKSDSEKEMDQLRNDVALYKDKYIRLIAEFENFKKRTIKEKVEFSKRAGEDIYLTLLPVLDDFERAMKSINSASDVDSLKEGVNLIYSKFKSTLEAQGLKEINSIGTPFNTDLHEAITNVDTPDEEMKGKVVDELEKGYFLNDKIIRYAKVVVGK
jgi:molecular chaperone GrpE